MSRTVDSLPRAKNTHVDMYASGILDDDLCAIISQSDGTQHVAFTTTMRKRTVADASLWTDWLDA